MESPSKMIDIIDKITLLLEYSEEQFWLSYFQDLKVRCLNHQNSSDVCRTVLKSFQGGMGSLNDLVLHKNGIPLIDENNKLDKLKDELFEFCSNQVDSK